MELNNVNVFSKTCTTMKRTKHQKKTDYEGEEEMDSFENPKKIYCSHKMTNISPCVNIRYHLRSRTIFDCEKCEGHALDNNISVVRESAILKTSYSAQTRYSVRNIPTEDVVGRPSTKVDTFTWQQPISKYSKHSINDRFECEPCIMKLPNEVITMIFSYLNVCELSTSVAPVCKHWHVVAHSPALWRKLCFDGDRISTESAKSLLTKSPHLSELIISNRDDVEQLLSHVCKTNRCVESVAVTRCSKSEVVNSWEWGLLHARCLNRLIKCCSKIRSLKLNDLRIRSDKFYGNLGILLPKLTCLHLSHSHFLTSKQIKNIAMKCCNLAQLWLSGENCCGHKEEWENAYQTLFQQRCRTLTHLQFDASKLRDEAFKDLSLCINLKFLHLNKAVELFSVGLNAIGTLPNLISLQLHKVRHLCSTKFLHLFQNGNSANLVNLSLVGCTCINDECASTIARLCPRLHVLSLALVEGITDKGIEIILKQCSSLHYLDIYDMKNITGVSFNYIPRYARELSFLVIEDLCDDEKEMHLKTLLELNSKLRVHRTNTWKIGEPYTCRLLQ